MSTVIIGAGSAIAKEYAKKVIEGDLISLTRNPENIQKGKAFNCDPSKEGVLFPQIDEIKTLIYFPGTITLKPISSITMDDIRKDFEVNFFGMVRAIQFYLPSVKKSSGNIILFSSVAVTKGLPFHTSIAAAKSAVEGFMRSLAAEVAPTVRVNAIAPSLVHTPLSSMIIDSEKKIESISKRHPLARVGEVSDIVQAIEYLSNASWVTGQVIHVDGGLSTLSLL